MLSSVVAQTSETYVDDNQIFFTQLLSNICKGYTSSKSNSAFVKNKANIFFNALKNEGKAKFEEVGTFFTNRFPSREFL